MVAVIVNGATPFGSISNSAINKLIEAARDIHRVRMAVANAQNDAPNPTGAALETGSNFGVIPSNVAGAKGADYAKALIVLDDALQSFMTTNEAFIGVLDNGK